MANHIAGISSSSRAIRQHEALEASQRQQDETREEEFASSAGHQDARANLEQSARSDLAKMSALSLSDDDRNGSVSSKTPSSQSLRLKLKRTSASSTVVAKPNLLSSKLAQITTFDDIDSNFDDTELHHCNVLLRLERKWHEITNNLDSSMKHLQECSQEVTGSSANCLEALMESVGTTCDSVDDELKAFYHLMTKCDELTTKLSIATSFRDEIKTLRKSVETLEQLYKNKPQAATSAGGATSARRPNMS